jgi:hypothetical protein
LGQGTSFTRVLDVNWDTDGSCEGIAQIHVAPGQGRRVQNATCGQVNHSGNNDADSRTGTYICVICEYMLYPAGELLYQNIDVFVGLKTTDASELMTHQISDHDVCTGSADIDPHDTALA